MMMIYLGFFSALYLGFLIYTIRAGKRSGGGLEEFFVSGRDVSLWPAVATLGATEIGLITIAYNAQKGFNEGFAAFHIGIAALIGCVAVGLTGFIVRPVRRTGVLTLPEFYEQRYGRDIRVFGALVMALGGILNMGLFLKVASLFLVALLGWQGGTASVNMLMIALIVVAVAYTSYGGMRSVIQTDIFQFVLLVAGLLFTAVYLLGLIPLETVIAVVEERKGEAGFDPFVNENFGTVYFLWMILVAGVVSAAVWPTALSRALCIQDERTVSRAYLIASLAFMGRMIVPALLGVLALSFFHSPEITGAGLSALNETFGKDSDLAATAAMLGVALPGWLLAFMAVALFASFMSTQDGYLFCWASIISRDILGPLTGKIDDEAFQKSATRAAIVLIALYELYWGLIYEGKEDIWDYLAVSGSIYFCSGIVLLVGGLYWKGATRRGALWALILGFSSVVALEPIKLALGLEGVPAPVIGFATIALAGLGFVVGSLSEGKKAHHGVS